MRKLLFVLYFLVSALFVNSQNLTVEGTAPDLYIMHTVAPKENFYSVGRLYNQAPRLIASFNNITMEKGLTIGQQVKIPLTTQNLDIAGNANPGETLIPLTHIVDKGETLFKLGNNFNASVEMLRKWNNLSSDNITPGSPVIVGNLKITNSSSVAVETKVTPEQSAANVATAPGRKESAIVKEMTADPKIAEQVTAIKTDVAVEKIETTPGPGAEVNSQKQTKVDTAVKKEPVVEANTNMITEQKEIAPVAASQTSKLSETVSTPVNNAVEKQESLKSNTNGKKMSSPIDLGSLSEGAFAGNFSSDVSAGSLKSKSGEAATFKSVSGWQDKKYYVLINDVVPGTILKITAAENKFVFAKVLGSMPEMKENNGILVRISNAAASHLGIIDPKFPVQISYYQ